MSLEERERWFVKRGMGGWVSRAADEEGRKEAAAAAADEEERSAGAAAAAATTVSESRLWRKRTSGACT